MPYKDKAKRAELARKRYHNNKDKELLRCKEYRENNKDKDLARKKIYRNNNKAKVLQAYKDYVKRVKNTPEYKIKRNLRKRMRRFIHGENKSLKSMELLGCTREFFLVYLESMFQPGMTWENYGLWHMDHIVPCCSFDLSDIEQQKQCFHYTNIQPLWAEDNLCKGGRI